MRRLWVIPLLVAGLLCAAVPLTAQRAGRAAPPPAQTNDDCLDCHGDASAAAESGRSIAVDGEKFGRSAHGGPGLTCIGCHTDLEKATEFPHAAKLAPVNCATCHEGAVDAFAKSIHAAARRKDSGSVAATCVDCHGSHDIRPASDPDSRTHALNLPATCSRCHGDPKVIAQGHIRVGNVAELYKDSIHGRAISRSGLLVAANCTHCHGSHDIHERNDPESRVFRAKIPATCGACHEGIQKTYDAGAHGRALGTGNAKAPVCADCHSAHEIRRVDVISWRLDVIRECGTCHADKIKTYRDTFHGQVTSLGFVRVATCSDCHGAHGVYPKSDPRSTVFNGNLLGTCRKCHPTASAGFAQYDPHADKLDRDRNPVLFYASAFMKWLLIGVFGFFGLHAVLWMPRGFVTRRRQRTNHPAPPEPRE